MVEASVAPSEHDRVDATLAALVPRPSIVRNVLAVAFAAVVLVGAGLAPDYAKPQVMTDGGSAELLPVSGAVLTATHLAVTGKGDVELVAVGGVPGAELVGAWVLPPDEMDRMYTAPQIQDRDALHTVEMRYRGDVPLDDLRLPGTVPAGQQAYVVLLWRITDCAALRPGSIPDLTIQSPVGMSTTVSLSEISGPTFDMQILTDHGVCDPSVTVGSPWSIDVP